MTTSLLDRSPVRDYFWPGIFLLMVMVTWPLINIYGIAAKKSWAGLSTYVLGIITMVWMIYETITIRTFSPLQPFVFLLGLGLFIGSRRYQSQPTE